MKFLELWGQVKTKKILVIPKKNKYFCYRLIWQSKVSQE